MTRRNLTLPLLLIIALVLSACGNEKFKADINYEIQPFEYTNQHNEKVSLDSLKGKPWLAMFIFTKCTTVCPPMTINMTDIQKSFKDKGLEDYNIVGFSVDPESDSPKVLKNHLKNYPVPDDSKWNLLTGYTQKEIESFAAKSFHAFVKKTDNTDQVTHQSTFFLVDQNGVVVKSYSGEIDVPFDTIAIDMETIIEDGK
ncbi:SCO family protein [Viridibacillus sp. NPDC096237]|uniref:SCO family protein n=1 Tax=Viridibacillus sp. NPDC096237 TaxID=3390721 RepID=UPI003CFC9287